LDELCGSGQETMGLRKGIAKHYELSEVDYS